jgi:transposase
MFRMLLNDEVWNKIKSILPGKEGDRGRTASDNRCFVEAVLWIGRTGSPWRDLPSQFGRCHTVYMRFSRWRRKGIWQRVAHVVSGEAEIDQVMIDSTIVRAHQHSAGARKTHGPQAIGRSRGGLTTKLHLAIDANGRPLRLIITEGQVADIVCAEELIGDLSATAVIADKG